MADRASSGESERRKAKEDDESSKTKAADAKEKNGNGRPSERALTDPGSSGCSVDVQERGDRPAAGAFTGRPT